MVFLQPYNTALELKEGLTRSIGIPAENQCLIFRGRQLPNESTMSMNDIHRGDFLYLVLRLRGGGGGQADGQIPASLSVPLSREGCGVAIPASLSVPLSREGCLGNANCPDSRPVPLSREGVPWPNLDNPEMSISAMDDIDDMVDTGARGSYEPAIPIVPAEPVVELFSTNNNRIVKSAP